MNEIFEKFRKEINPHPNITKRTANIIVRDAIRFKKYLIKNNMPIDNWTVKSAYLRLILDREPNIEHALLWKYAFEKA